MDENGTQFKKVYFPVYRNRQVILKTYPIKKIGHHHSWAFGHMFWDKLPHSDLEGREQEWVARLRFRNLSLFKHVQWWSNRFDTEHVGNKISKLGPAPAIWSHQSRGPKWYTLLVTKPQARLNLGIKEP